VNNALQLVSVSGFSREQVELVKRTVAKGATDDELALFLTLAHKYDLDPFAKEIWCIKRQKKNSQGAYVDDPNTPATITTSRDGYLKIALKDANYDGLKGFVVRENDEFSVDTANDSIVHKFGAKRGKIIGAWSTCFHKSRRPVTVYVDYEEYNAGTPTWNKYPSAMIQKVAEAFVLKRQFGINGLVTQEELGLEDPSVIDITPTPVAIPAVKETDEKEEQRKLIKEQKLQLAHEVAEVQLRLGLDGEIVRAECETKFGIPDPRKLSLSQLSELRDHFLQMERDHNGSSDVITDEEMEEMPF